MTVLARAPIVLRFPLSLLLALALVLPTVPFDGALHAQQNTLTNLATGRIKEAYGSKESAAKEVINELSNLATQAEQLAAQGGKFAGRTVGPKFASVTGQLLQVILNFDALACDVNVMALGLKQRALIVEATKPGVSDPDLDRAVQQVNELIAKLQALCNRYVHDVPTAVPGAAGAVAAGDATAVETAEPEEDAAPKWTVEQRICYQRCAKLYDAFLDARRAYERADREAKTWRQRVGSLPQDAARAEADAAKAEAEARESEARLKQLTADMKAATTPAARDRIAGEIAKTQPNIDKAFAERKRAEATEARAKADEAERWAREEEADASAKYATAKELYDAWAACADHCVAEVYRYTQQVLDPYDLFIGMPKRAPVKPPYYSEPVPVPPTPAMPAQPPKVSRVITPPVGIAGGMLAGVVLDENDEPREDQQVAIDLPDGSVVTAVTGIGGGFAVPVPVAVGALAIGIVGQTEKPVAIDVLRPEDLEVKLPDNPLGYVSPGQQVTLGQPYRGVGISTPAETAMGVPPYQLPVGVVRGPQGTNIGLTQFEVPKWVKPGQVAFTVEAFDGQTDVSIGQVFGYLDAWLEQDKLRSGQRAQFGYVLQFGDERTSGAVTVTIATTGPITYDKVGQPQRINIDQGKATLTGYIQAQQGSPTGIPFSIIPTFSDIWIMGVND